MLPLGEERPLDLQNLEVPAPGPAVGSAARVRPAPARRGRSRRVGERGRGRRAFAAFRRYGREIGSGGRARGACPGTSWTFADAVWSPGGTETLVVANPGDVSVIVTVVMQAADGTPIVPQEVVLGPGVALPLFASGDASTVGLVPPDVHHTITVDSTGDATFVTHLTLTTQARPEAAPPQPPPTEPPPTEPPPTVPTTVPSPPGETTTSGPSDPSTGSTTSGSTTVAPTPSVGHDRAHLPRRRPHSPRRRRRPHFPRRPRRPCRPPRRRSRRPSPTCRRRSR